MTNIHFLQGDATSPQAKGNKIIAYVCNDIGGWGRGFVLAISRRWPQPESEYRRWYRGRASNDFGLGAVQLVAVERYIWIANLVGQHGTKTGSKGPPIRYDAIAQCLVTLAGLANFHSASVHMPRIGCGLAGGKWDVCLRQPGLKEVKMSARSRLRVARREESAPSPMKNDQDQNSTDSAEIEALITRIERGQLRDEDAQLLTRLLRLLLRLITLLQHKNASLSPLKRLLFGPRSDKRREANSSPGAGAEGESDSASSTSTENSSPDTPKGARSQSPSRKGGHGRMGAESYTGARVVRCRDAELTHGARCPHDGCRGKLYDTKQPAIFIRLTGQPLVGANRFEQEVLRCSACQERFTALLPAGVRSEKYDETCDVKSAQSRLMETRSRDGSVNVRREPSGRSI